MKEGKTNTNQGDAREVWPEAASLYYYIAKEAYNSASEITDDFKKPQAIVTTIVFSALSLEAFINQEYAIHPETEELIEYIDSTPLETKWLLLPLLLGFKKTFDKGMTPFQTFKELVRYRNRLVHFKYGREVYSTQDAQPVEKPNYNVLISDIERAKKYLDCVEGMIEELNRITNGGTSKFSSAVDSKHLGECWSYLKAAVAAELQRDNG